MEQGREMTEVSGQKATAAGRALEDIAKQIGRISDMSTQIATGAEQQSLAVGRSTATWCESANWARALPRTLIGVAKTAST